MKSVTRIAATLGLQPRGGYINPNDMLNERIDDSIPTNYEGNVIDGYEKAVLGPNTIGLVVDYLTRLEFFLALNFNRERSFDAAFRISLLGARLSRKTDEAQKLLDQIKDGYESNKKDYKKIVQAASELVSFDTVVRVGRYFEDVERVEVTDADAKLIKEMVSATLYYLLHKQKDPCPDPRFHAMGAENVAPSDADWITEDSLIDIKCTKDGPKSSETFQLILYYLLGMNEAPSTFRKIKYLKILNPRLCRVYTYEIDKLKKEDLKHIEIDIMGYKESVFDKPEYWYLEDDSCYL